MNDYMQTLLEQITKSPAGLETGGLLICIAMSLLGSLFVLFTYKIFYENSSNRGLHNSFLIIGPAVTGIFLAIQFSLPLSLGLLGALSIIRFRTPVKDPEEVSYLLILIASSIACATFNFVLQGIVLGIVFLVQLVYKRCWGNEFFNVRRGHVLLSSTDTNLQENSVSKIMQKNLEKAELRSANKQGDVISFHYTFKHSQSSPYDAIESDLKKLTTSFDLNLLMNELDA